MSRAAMKTDSRMETNGVAQGLSVLAVLKAIRRRKLYLLMPVLLLTAGAGIYALRLPERFRAQALIAAEPVIPAHYLTDRVDAAATVNVQDQLRTVRETLFSPLVLETVIPNLSCTISGKSRYPGRRWRR